jgi:FK506-binding nuclear protein
VIIEDIVIGTGAICCANNKIDVHYKGWLKNGRMFDQSTKKPFRFRLGAGEVIRGWDIGETFTRHTIFCNIM